MGHADVFLTNSLLHQENRIVERMVMEELGALRGKMKFRCCVDMKIPHIHLNPQLHHIFIHITPQSYRPPHQICSTISTDRLFIQLTFHRQNQFENHLFLALPLLDVPI